MMVCYIIKDKETKIHLGRYNDNPDYEQLTFWINRGFDPIVEEEIVEEEDETYRVEIFEIKTDNVVAVIGSGLSESKAERRVMTGLSRVDRDNYGVRDVLEVD